jgi:hypothetical protein
MATTPHRLELTLLPERFAISQLAATAPIPEWATRGAFFSVTRTRDELSVVRTLSRPGRRTIATRLEYLKNPRAFCLDGSRRALRAGFAARGSEAQSVYDFHV